jgi:hypothetical protein
MMREKMEKICLSGGVKVIVKSYRKQAGRIPA